MPALPIGRSDIACVRALLILVALVAALGAAAAVAAAPASAATSEDYFYISSLGPTYATGDYFGESGAGPNGIATDSAGNVYVTIPRGFVKFWASGTVACVYKGDNDYTAGYSYGLDVDANGNVYYADRTNHLIAKLHPDNNGVNGTVYRWVSLTGKDGSGTPLVYGDGGDLNIGSENGEFNFPSDVAVDGHYLWVTDMLNHRIQKFETATGDNTLSYAGKWGNNDADGTSGSDDGDFNMPRAIDAQSGTDGHVFVVEQVGRRVQEFTKNGVFFGKFGSTTAADPLYLLSPTGIDVDAQGDVYVTDLETTTSWVGKFRSSGGAWSRVTRIGGYGTGNAQFTFPWNSVVDPNGYLWVTDTQNYRVKKFARDTTAPEVHATGVWSVWTNDPRHPELIASDPTVTGQYTSGVADIYYSMTGGAGWNTYLEPLWFAVQGDNAVTYYAEDAVGNESAQVTGHVYLDTTKPVTTVSGVPAWSKTDVSVTLTASADGLSPIAATQYRLQGASTWTTYSGPFAVTAEGTSTYEYRTYDTAANYEAVKTLTVNIDKTTPVTAASGVPAGWSNANVAVTLTPGADGKSPIASTQCRLQGSETWTTYAGAFTVSAEGASTYDFRSADGAGNVEATKTVTVRIDKTAPVTTVSGVPAGWSNANVAVTLTPGSDGRSAVASTEYRLQGSGTWSSYGAPISVSAEGVTTYEYRSTDAAGNVEAAKTLTVRIDKTVPVTAVSGVPAGWSNANVAVTLTPGADGKSPIAATQYRLLGATWTTYSAPFTVSAEGSSVYEYRSTDGAGNAEATKTVTVRIDKTAPVTTFSGVPTTWSKAPVLVTLTPSGDGPTPVASTEYRIQGAPTWVTYLGPFTITTQGASVYEYRSTDGAGNVESTKTLTAQVDSVRPVPRALKNKTVKRNAKVKLPYTIVDAPGAQAKVTIKIYKGKAFKKKLTAGTKAANASLTYVYTCKLPKGKYTWKVYATDLAGNTQAKPAIRTLTVK